MPLHVCASVRHPAAAGVEPPLQSSPVVLFSLAYAVVRLVLEALIVQGRANAELRAEVLALRHQLRVMERQAGRPRWQPCDRLLLAAISRVLTRPAWRSLLPSPETLLRWHRELVRQKWAAYRRRPRRHRPIPSSEFHQLILRLAGENSRWGYRRIQGELLKLGHRCSHLTVRRVLRRHGIPPAPRRGQRTWREFAAGWVPGNRNGCPRVSGWSRLADGDADVAIDLKIAQFDSHPGQ